MTLTFVLTAQRIYIPLPEAPARSHMFKVHLGDTPHNLTPQDFDELGRRTQGFSGSDVNVVVKDVLFEPVRKTQEATHFRSAQLPLMPLVRKFALWQVHDYQIGSITATML